MCLPLEKVCNFVNDCPNGEEELDCGYDEIDFQDGFKKWKETSGNGLYEWARRTKNTNFNNGPSTGMNLTKEFII